MKKKFIFITGGVASGIGKGISGSSIGRIMKEKGFKVIMQKLDPYINVDAGLINPREHGEVFVTDDGYEGDLDLGHYERYIGVNLTNKSSITAGRIYQNVIKKERNGNFGGKTIQVVPHIIDEIKNSIYELANESDADLCIVEIGGTVGDIESQPFYEAIRQIRNEQNFNSVLFAHCTYLPFLETSQEYKTKPTQNSVSLLTKLGIQPNLIIVRARGEISSKIKEKISLFTNVKPKHVIEAKDQKIIYELVNDFYDQNVDSIICKHLELKDKKPNRDEWQSLINGIKKNFSQVKIAIVGKYNFSDAYISVIEALKSASYKIQIKVNYDFLYSADLNEKNYQEILGKYDGILVPGGFGEAGINGKILAIKYARENKIPFLGICYGMQLALIEYARNVLNYKGANSTEIDKNTPYPIIDIISSKISDTKAGVLRLGKNECKILENTKTKEIYNSKIISERHRHKYEFTTEIYNKYFKDSDVIYAATSKSFEFDLIEIIELKNHPFFIGCQFHPEFKSRITKPVPLFLGLLKSIVKNNKN